MFVQWLLVRKHRCHLLMTKMHKPISKKHDYEHQLNAFRLELTVCPNSEHWMYMNSYGEFHARSVMCVPVSFIQHVFQSPAPLRGCPIIFWRTSVVQLITLLFVEILLTNTAQNTDNYTHFLFLSLHRNVSNILYWF